LMITWMSVRSNAVKYLIKAEPRLLFHRGEFLRRAMRDERVNEEEMLQAMRSQGIGEIEGIEAVVLETDGSLSIIKATDGRAEVLSNVAGLPGIGKAST